MRAHSDSIGQRLVRDLEAQAKWLPQYADAIPAAKKRLENPKVKTRDWKGAARLDVRSVDELRHASATKKAAERHGLGTKAMG